VRLVNTVIVRNCLADSVVPLSQHSINQQLCVQVTSLAVLCLEKETGNGSVVLKVTCCNRLFVNAGKNSWFCVCVQLKE